MATPEQRAEKLGQVAALLTELAAITPADLARTEALAPDINFAPAVPHFESILDIVKQLHQRDCSRLSSKQLGQVESACGAVKALVDRVRAFTLKQGNPADVCTALINEVKGAYDTVAEPLLLPLAFTATQATDYARIEREAKGYHATMQAEAHELQTFIAECRDDASAALAALQQQAAEAGVATNAQIFLQDVTAHNALAQKWLRATGVCAIATLLAALGAVLTSLLYTPPTVSATIQLAISKLIFLSVLLIATIWCGRTHKAQKHNEIANKHRANALMTFKAFVEGTADARVKDAILLQASQAAFVGRTTGFESHDGEQQSMSPVVEVLGRSIPRAIPSSSG